MSTDGEVDRNGSRLLVVVLVSFVILCAGSVGGGIYFIWRAAKNVAEQAAEARARMDEAAAATRTEQEASAEQGKFERVARAVGEAFAARDPLANSFAMDGKPLLSWRVHLLPRLGESDLYRRFKLDEPWDGPNNKELLNRIPAVYNPSGPRWKWPPGGTYLRGFTHEGTLFEPGTRIAIQDIPAGADNTLAIVDAGDPVPWTQPDTWTWRPGDPRPWLGGSSHDQDRFLAATATGRVLWIKRSIPDDLLRSFFDRRRDPKSSPSLPGRTMPE